MKLPVNQFLYVTILGLLAGSGWKFYETWKEIRKEDARAEARLREASDTCRELVEKGRSLNLVAKGPNYTQNRPWDYFKEANLIGKEPPPPPKPIDQEATKEPEEKPENPLDSICNVVMLVRRGDQSLVTVRYVDSTVQPPAEIVAAFTDPTPKPAKSTRPGRRKNQPRRAKNVAPSMPRARLDGYVHTLSLEDSLWPPFDHIKFVGVDQYAQFAEFSRKTKDGEDGEPERLYRNELDLSQELLDELYEKGYGDPSKPRPNVKAADVPDGPFGAGWEGNKAWAGGDETKRVGSDFHIGRNDWTAWNDDSSRIINKDIHTRTYSNNGVSGVQVTKVSERFREFGVQSGDVILSINGEAVKSKAQAVTVGKRLYKRGVRTFDVVFLSRGREVTRSYVAPAKGR